ncbi:hypothetical protein PIB30_108071, partial [Stylosanthes scabra]|nr:hypothetical protein [Stylosanthes scabra]
ITLDVTVGTDSVGRRWYGTRRSTEFFFWEWFMVLDRFNPLRRIGLATDQVSVLSDLGHCRPVGSAKSCRPKANPATKMLLRLTVQRNESVNAKDSELMRWLNAKAKERLCAKAKERLCAKAKERLYAKAKERLMQGLGVVPLD